MKKTILTTSLLTLLASANFLFGAENEVQTYPNYIGGTQDGSDYDGDITNTLTGGTYNNFYGGNYLTAISSYQTMQANVNGNITNNLDGVTINGYFIAGNWKNDVNGGTMPENGSSIGSITGTITNNINNSSINGKFYTASLSSGPYKEYSTGTIKAIITTITNSYVKELCLTGGGAISKINGNVDIVVNNSTVKELFHNYGTYIGGDLNLTFKDSTIGNYFYAGTGPLYSATGEAKIAGNINVELSGTSVAEEDIHLGSAYGAGTGRVDGNASITLKDTAKVAGTIYGREAENEIGGNAILNIDSSYAGEQALKVKGFDVVNVASGSTVDFAEIGTNNLTVAKDATANANGLNISNQNITKTTSGSYTTIDNGFVNNSGTTTLTDVSFNNNSITLEQTNLKEDGGRIAGGFAVVKAGELNVSGNFSNNTFTTTGEANGSSSGCIPVYGGLFYTSGDGEKSITVSNSTISNNTSTSFYNTQGGIFALDGTGAATLTIENSTISNNGAVATSVDKYLGAMGGVISSVASNKTIVVSNTTFDGNYSKSTGSTSTWGGGGVAYLTNTVNATFNDVKFINNYVESDSKYIAGGAILAGAKSILNFNTTKNAKFVGNYAEVANERSDEYGGFLVLLANATANFNVSSDSELVIGDGREGYDSIISKKSGGIHSAVINKLGAGTMTVNSSMQYFSGTLNVKEGVMNVNNGLDAKSINISNNATLGLMVNGDNTLSNSNLALSNNGTINLVASAKADNTTGYKVAAAENLTWGNVKTFGGTFDATTGTFTASQAQSVTLNSETSSAIVQDQGRVSITDENNKTVVQMAFSDVANETGVKINSVKEVEFSTDLKTEDGLDFTNGKAFEFNVENLATDGSETIVLSFYVGDLTFNSSDFTVFHKGNGEDDKWEIVSDVTGLTYDGEYVSFAVNHFSSWAVMGSAVPEPAEWAAIFGAIALGFVIYRRRK